MVSRIVQTIRARVCRSRFAIAFRFKRLRHQFAVRLLQQNLDLALGFFQLLLHLRDNSTPSSKSFIASSSESCGLSSLRTTSSRRASERSKSGFFCGSGLFGAGVFTRPFQAALTSRSARKTK